MSNLNDLTNGGPASILNGDKLCILRRANKYNNEVFVSQLERFCDCVIEAILAHTLQSCYGRFVFYVVNLYAKLNCLFGEMLILMRTIS